MQTLVHLPQHHISITMPDLPFVRIQGLAKLNSFLENFVPGRHALASIAPEHNEITSGSPGVPLLERVVFIYYEIVHKAQKK